MSLNNVEQDGDVEERPPNKKAQTVETAEIDDVFDMKVISKRSRYQFVVNAASVPRRMIQVTVRWAGFERNDRDPQNLVDIEDLIDRDPLDIDHDDPLGPFTIDEDGNEEVNKYLDVRSLRSYYNKRMLFSYMIRNVHFYKTLYKCSAVTLAMMSVLESTRISV